MLEVQSGREDWLHGNWPGDEAVRIYLDDDCQRFALVDADIYPKLANRTFCHVRGGGNRGISSYARCNRSRVYLHLLIVPSSSRPSPKHTILDHINRDGLDCRRANLEWVTPGQNVRRWIYANQKELPWGKEKGNSGPSHETTSGHSSKLRD